MSRDRLAYILSICIAAALCSGAMVWLGTSFAEVAESAPLQQVAPPSGMTIRAPTPGPATLPLRVRLGYAFQTPPTTGEFGLFCGTAVVVWNLTPSSIDVEVEYFDLGSSIGHVQYSVPAQNPRVCWSDNSPPLHPVNMLGTVAKTGWLRGVATVHASDPRILTSAFLVCRADASGEGAVASLVNIPTFPVGATAEYFQANMPAEWTPPLAEPELRQ